MEWKETFNNGILSIDGECERLGPLENYKNDAIEIDIKGVFKIISSKCFLNFVKLKEIKFPDTIETLEDNIIQGVKLIESLTLPKSLKTISTAQTFDWCYSIKNTPMPNSGKKKLKSNAFSYKIFIIIKVLLFYKRNNLCIVLSIFQKYQIHYL